jgi:hypothetical protein
MLQVLVLVHSSALRLAAPVRGLRRGQQLRSARGDRGQTTAEYALVLLGAAAIAALVITWASGTDAVGKLMDFVLGHVIGSVK